MISDDTNLHEKGADDFRLTGRKMNYRQFLEWAGYTDDVVARLCYGSYGYGFDRAAELAQDRQDRPAGT